LPTIDLPQVREEFGFQRTECGCASCQVHCRHIPGSLAPADLTRLCPQGQEVFSWAEQHLRALTDKPFPTLVPARHPNGSCHWFFEGRCLVHDRAPYGCAFFDSHMTAAETDRREAATVQARHQDAAAGGLYYRVWLHLRQRGLTAPSGDRSAVLEDLGRIARSAKRARRRARGD
jgi:hypothetical protein